MNLRFIAMASGYFQKNEQVVIIFLRGRRRDREPQLTTDVINLLKSVSKWKNQSCSMIHFRSMHTRVSTDA